jgi:DNA-binding transcriptional LysR family regulator
MNEQQMKSIISVAKHKSISRASEELNISQQGLSRVIGNIENELGVKIFTRTSGGMELTDFGLMILPVVQSMLNSHEEYTKIINGILEKYKETITIVCEHDFFPYHIPIDLTSRLRNINVRTVIADDINACIVQILDGIADFGLCHNNEDFKGLQYIPLVSEPIAILAHRDHYLAQKNELVLADLKDVPQLFPAVMMPKIIELYLAACIKEGFYPNYVLKSKDLFILLQNIREKAGVMPGTRYIIPNPLDVITAIPLKNESLRMEFGFLVKPPVKNSVLSFINAVKKYYDQQG